MALPTASAPLTLPPRTSLSNALFTDESSVEAATSVLPVRSSTTEPALKGGFAKEVRGGNQKGAEAIGTAIASRSIEKGIKRVVFDRSGFLYHGRIRAVADAARKAGLEF